MTYKKKLIEVALPLDAINKASAREKSIRHGHPSTLHLWWARRPLAAARAVLFAQMVDDPSAHPDIFKTEKAQEKERQRLFRIIEDLVQWENTNNEEVLERARAEIWQSWRATCAENADHPQAKDLFDRFKLPAFHDPFAGGGTIPLEAQRLGLEAYASDLNPVAVLINKAMIEIPPKFAGRPPVNPEARERRELFERTWRGAEGLAEDVRYYGRWMREEAEKRIGHLYPKVEITAEMANDPDNPRPDLKPLVGQKLTVIAWIWARTVGSPNPAFAHVEVPLASTYMLSTKRGHESYVEPVIEGDRYRFRVRIGTPRDEGSASRGSKAGGSHSSFLCLLSGAPMPFDYLRAQGKAGRLGARLMAIVAEGESGRVYLSPMEKMEEIAKSAKPGWQPDVEISHWPGRTNVVEYGLTHFDDLFTARQLVALTTFSDLVHEAHAQVVLDASTAGEFPGAELDDSSLMTYADAVATMLSFVVSRLADRCSSICSWDLRDGQGRKPGIRNVFSRQAIPMTWDYAEANPLSEVAASAETAIGRVSDVLERLPCRGEGFAFCAEATLQEESSGKIVSCDPPYYDNIGYADLSDFFYVWLRRSLRPVYLDLFSTLAVPKAEELVATPYRHGSKEKAESFFMAGMTRAMERLATQAHPAFPVSIYYAFKQSETESGGTASTGWETFLDAVIRAGFAVSGTWPVRTELSNRIIGARANALASSVVLSCRPRAANAPSATRREFLAALRAELPKAMIHLQRSNIAPVDLAQAAIGPGMAIYTGYSQVLDPEGRSLSVRQALALINQVLDEVLAQQEGDFDADSRWALAWFEELGFAEGGYGRAETLSTAKNTSVSGMAQAGILSAKAGKVRLLRPEELPATWDPAVDTRLTVWEMVHQLIRSLERGEAEAAELVAKLGAKAEVARELAYRLYTLCERKKRAQEALAYNSLVQSWPEIQRLAQKRDTPAAEQKEMF